MLGDVLAGKVAHIVVLNLSRLGRDSTACWDLIAGVLPRRGITFHSIQDGSDVARALKMHEALLEAYGLERGRK